MNVKILTLVLSALFIAACSSNQPKIGVENVGKEVVVSTLNDESRPNWVIKAFESSFYKEDGEIVSIGIATLNESSRIDAGFTISELNAKANLAKVLSSKIESYAQTAQEGTDFDSVDLRSLTSEATKISASGIKPAKKFYERVAVTGSDGKPKIEIRCYSQVRLSQEDFQKALVNAAKQDKNASLSQRFAKQVNAHFDQIIGLDTEEARKPSNNSDE